MVLTCNASIMWQLHEGMFFLFRKRLCWSLSDTYVMFMNSDRYFFLPFFDVFCAEVHPVRRQKSCHVTPCLQCGNHQWRKCEPDVKKWWGSATRLESRLVTWCLWTNGRIGCKRFLMDQSRRVVSRKTHRLQWLFYFNALSLPNHVCIHFREIFEWAFTDGVTTFVNMWLCCRQALIFWLINFAYFTVWCLLLLCHL